jgi:hypothetical protein
MMQKKSLAIIIHPDGEIEKRMFDKNPRLPDLYKMIGTDIVQMVPYFSKMAHDGKTLNRGTAWVDEEGLFKGSPINPVATELWRENLRDRRMPHSDVTLVGTVVFHARVEVEDVQGT